MENRNSMATAGMVLGIIGIIFCWVPVLNWILAALAIIFGGIGLARVKTRGVGKGKAISALILGIIVIVLNIVAASALMSTLGMK